MSKPYVPSSAMRELAKKFLEANGPSLGWPRIAMTATPYFGSMDGYPVRGTDSEAWIFQDGKWQPLHPAEGSAKASVLTEADFKERFGELPHLAGDGFPGRWQPRRHTAVKSSIGC
jgi:hypothetical protein